MKKQGQYKRQTRDEKMVKVTDSIIEALKNGTVPWRKPWQPVVGLGENAFNPNLHHNAITGRRYNGFNVLILSVAQEIGEYETPEWLTFNQAKKAGGYVKAGQRSHTISYWNIEEKEVEEEDANGNVTIVKKKIFDFRTMGVFNIGQTENVKLPDHSRKLAKIEAIKNSREWDDVSEAEIVANSYIGREHNGPALKLVGGSDAAFYHPFSDSITLPEKVQFSSGDRYYSTLFHEMGHSTGHTSRLDRDFNGHEQGSRDYSFEELVAELTAAYLSRETGTDNTDASEQNAAYIASWLKRLENDRNMIIKASAHAPRAAHHILKQTGLYGSENAPEEAEVEAVAA